jgi:hypothetical protein
MMNAIPVKYKNSLALPFLLTHGVGHNERMWIPLFSMCYFHYEKDGDDTQSKPMACIMDRVIVSRCLSSNAIMVYYPWNQQYYELDSYRIDSYCLPDLVYPTLKYNSILFCSLLSDDNPSFKEMYPLGMRVERIDPFTHLLLAGTVVDIPFPLVLSSKNSLPHYMILFNNGTTAFVPLGGMAGIIPLPPIDVDDSDSHNSLLVPFLHLNLNITYEYKGHYHKGFLRKWDGIYCFVFK